jgi:ribosomal protein S18 acetylase RimI-like enzyme
MARAGPAGRPPPNLITVEPLRPELDDVAARLFSDAFLDDPAFVGIGPRNDTRRWSALLRLHRAALKVARRWGGPIHGAMEGDRLLAASVVFDEGLFPPPRRSFLLQLGFALAGPAPVVRGLSVTQLMERRHVKDPHLYLEILAAHPHQQRRGAGRALLGRLGDDADQRGLPVYLETTKPENVPYYGSFGFEVQGEAPIPGDATMWFMLRPPRQP